MGVYTRFKRSPEGFRALVELLESTPASRRQKMIDVGMQEDPEYTRKAMEYVLTFEDITVLPDLELAEVMAKAPSRMTAYALSSAPEEVKMRFIQNAPPMIAAEIRDYLSIKVGPREIGGAQLKLVAIARELEKKGFVRVKKIPSAI